MPSRRLAAPWRLGRLLFNDALVMAVGGHGLCSRYLGSLNSALSVPVGRGAAARGLSLAPKRGLMMPAGKGGPPHTQRRQAYDQGQWWF